jgi:hypothetical protein
VSKNSIVIVSIVFYLTLQVVPVFAGLQVQNEALKQNTLRIFIDPRIELLAAVQLLSGYGERYGLITRYDFPYKDDVIKYFSPYKNRSAVKLFEEMSADGFSYDAPPTVMLYLSEPPALDLQQPFTDYLKQRAGGEKKLDQLISSLRDFANETEFMAFFKANKKIYQQVVSSVQGKIGSIDYVQTLQDYYGMKQNSFNIILAPLFVGGFGPRIERPDGTYDIYNICGPLEAKKGLPIFGSTESLRHIAWHEFSHSFVNPTTEKFSKEVANYQSLYEPISERMKQQAYPDWQTCVNEHIVRAVTTRLAYREISKDAGDRALQNEKGRGFAYAEPLCKKLEQYENQRDKYPTFVDFYSELIKTFKALAEDDLDNDFYSIPFKGTINAVMLDRSAVVLIVPTNQKDKRIQNEIQSYVEEIKYKFFKNSLILTDREALQKDLSNNSIVAYGTPDGNLFIAEHLAGMPVKIESDKIVADKIYKGTNLRFISAWPNPWNPDKGMVFYTAQQPEDIPNINSVFHGPTDYVIARGTQVLKSENYNKKNGTWSLNHVDEVIVTETNN